MRKTTLSDLALLGGVPAFPDKLHVGRPNIPDRARLRQRIDDMLDRRWLSNNGPLVQEFEQRVAALCGVRHCVAMCNGTLALEVAIRALGLTGEVILPSFTFVATAHALQWQQITPVFADVDPRTHNLDPRQVERLITPRTSAILGVHVWGRACEVEALQTIADRRGLPLLFDAAHAFGCTHQGRPIGGFGRVEVFSFHATKFVHTFEGGAAVTDDGELALHMRQVANFGFAGYDEVTALGTNAKMSEVCAAMGLCGLESMAEWIEGNRRNSAVFHQELRDISGLRLLHPDPAEQHNFQYIVCEVDAGKTGIDRDTLVRVLHAENVLARRYFHPGCHRMEPYRTLYPHSGHNLPHTEALTDRALVLPTGTAVDAEQVRLICQIVRLCLDNGPALTARLA